MAKRKNKITGTTLTPKQELFCSEYLVDFNASKAALAAGYKSNSAYSMGHENLKKPELQKRLRELVRLKIEKAKYDAQKVLERHEEIDGLDVIDILDENRRVKDIEEWPRAWRVTIEGIEVIQKIKGDTPCEIIKIKWPSKLKNLEAIGRHVDVSAYREHVELSATDQTLRNIIDILDGKTCGLPGGSGDGSQ
ncbi:terminase small subunit [Desulfotalea psychrophila]|uniref:Related to terminase, small subunit n=1 Tax=Desulfotalea psychrophila (strain LSv54 / DSM 12343) TaxID=177439 RepID=Q6ALN9_DESPS|nr:terminase small subunit [Desulfotalea psychrophila]CAG36736.1 related to terminase, small subunit [Desulfotalea psychrophila LSv54]